MPKSKSVVIAGIDPGSKAFGLAALLVRTSGVPEVLAIQEEILPDISKDFRLMAFANLVDHFLAVHRPKFVALETGFIPRGRSAYKMNPYSILMLSEFRGVARYLTRKRKAEVVEVNPFELRSGLGLNSNATKGDIRVRISLYLRLKTAPKEDAADAAALALWAGEESRKPVPF